MYWNARAWEIQMPLLVAQTKPTIQEITIIMAPMMVAQCAKKAKTKVDIEGISMSG